MLKTIEVWDKKLFIILNSLHTKELDQLMLLITHRLTWVPLYLLLIYLIFRELKLKQGLFSVALIILAVGLSDFITSGLIKPYFERLRPCHDLTMTGKMILTGNCGGKYGFVSSHAANSFALFFAMSKIKLKIKNLSSILFLWAFVVSFSRIYLGVHYPIDVFLGAIVGTTISQIIFETYNLKIKP